MDTDGRMYVQKLTSSQPRNLPCGTKQKINGKDFCFGTVTVWGHTVQSLPP